MDIESQFRRIVERAVKERGSVRQLTQDAGVNNSTFSEWMAGRRAGLNWSTVARVCNHLGVTLNDPGDSKQGKRKATRKKR